MNIEATKAVIKATVRHLVDGIIIRNTRVIRLNKGSNRGRIEAIGKMSESLQNTNFPSLIPPDEIITTAYLGIRRPE